MDMLTLLFIILFFGIFGKLIGFAFRASWGIMKVLFTLIFLPVIIGGIAISGLISLAFPMLIVVGIVALVKNAVA